MTQILVADDEASIRIILTRAMEKKGFQVRQAQNGAQALECLKNEPIDIALIDIRMPELSGLEILNYKNEFSSNPFIFVITAQDTMENAVEAMKRGAYDYLTKPFDLDEISRLVDLALETRRRQSEYEHDLKGGTADTVVTPMIVGKSKVVQEIYKTIGKVANQDITVLIEGESGTGKELVAKAIHFQGKRANQTFVAVNCSAIPANLLESELFGYKKGAYTGAIADKMGYFERANQGTLFLDEIGDLPLPLQAKLLRVLQEKEIQRLGDTKTIPINVRIIAATNQNLATKVQKGVFREDLYFRLNVIPIYLPPLRERRSDIALLIDFFLNRNSQEFKLPRKKLSEEALSYLSNLDWPGNVRELENLLKRVFVLTQSSVLEEKDFKQYGLTTSQSTSSRHLDSVVLEEIILENLKVYFERIAPSEVTDLYNRFIPFMERPLIMLTLKKMKGNQLKAADVLGINRNTLRKKIRELNIDLRTLETKVSGD